MPVRLILLFVSVFSACGVGNALEETCQRVVEVECQKRFQCSSSPSYASESECVAQNTKSRRCSVLQTVTCTDFDRAAWDACLDTVSAASCSSSEQSAACLNQVPQPTPSACSSSDGSVVCFGGEDQTTSTGCSAVRNACSDGHTYQLVCHDGMCDCLVDSKSTKTFGGATCPDSDSLNAACGWNLLPTW